jgi:flagellar basal body rod protein FlgC
MTGELDVLAAAAAGMEAQREALSISARNVAAAETAGPDGRFARLVPQFTLGPLDDQDDGPVAVEMSGVRTEPGRAGALGEMVTVLDGERAYEANAALFDLGKRLAERTIDLERQ